MYLYREVSITPCAGASPGKFNGGGAKTF